MKKMTRFRWVPWLLGLSLLLSGCGEKQQPLYNGEPAPGFSLQTLDGRTVRFPDDLAGKVMAIRFWADWCPFCKGEMKALEPVYQRYKDRGLVILAVNVRQHRETALRFLQPLGISYDALLDEEGRVARAYGVIGLPTTFFVDAKGILRQRIIGESTPDTFEQIVLHLMTPGPSPTDVH